MSLNELSRKCHLKQSLLPESAAACHFRPLLDRAAAQPWHRRREQPRVPSSASGTSGPSPAAAPDPPPLAHPELLSPHCLPPSRSSFSPFPARTPLSTAVSVLQPLVVVLSLTGSPFADRRGGAFLLCPSGPGAGPGAGGGRKPGCRKPPHSCRCPQGDGPSTGF